MAKYPFKNCDICYGNDHKYLHQEAQLIGWDEDPLNLGQRLLDSNVALNTCDLNIRTYYERDDDYPY